MIKQSEFHAIMRAVAHSAGSDEVHAHLNSILFEFLEGSTRVVSTDGHRITIATLNIIAPLGSFLAPIADIKELLRIFKHKSDKRISFVVQGDGLIVTNGEATLLVPRLGQEFPDYRQAMPPDGDICDASVDRFDAKFLTQALKACEGLIGSGRDVTIIKRGEGIPMTLRPVLDPSLEVLQALDISIMALRRGV